MTKLCINIFNLYFISIFKKFNLLNFWNKVEENSKIKVEIF